MEQPQQEAKQHQTDVKFDVIQGTVTFVPKAVNGVALINPTQSVVTCDMIIELAAMIVLKRKEVMVAQQQQLLNRVNLNGKKG